MKIELRGDTHELTEATDRDVLSLAATIGYCFGMDIVGPMLKKSGTDMQGMKIATYTNRRDAEADLSWLLQDLFPSFPSDLFRSSGRCLLSAAEITAILGAMLEEKKPTS